MKLVMDNMCTEEKQVAGVALLDMDSILTM